MATRHTSTALRLGYLTATAAVFVGPPLALTRLIGNPIASIDWSALPNRLRAGDVPRDVLIGALAGALWIVWACIVASVVLEVIAALRHLQSPALPTFPGTQAFARRLVSGFLLTVNSSAAMFAAPMPALADVQALELTLTDTADPYSQTAVSSDRDAPTTAEAATYTVERGDTLMSVAQEALGDSGRWKELRTLNVGAHRPGLAPLDAGDTTIVPGMVLALPDDAAAPLRAEADAVGSADDTAVAVSDSAAELDVTEQGSGDREDPAPMVVEKGDHFWAIAEQELEQAWGRTPTDAEVVSYWQDVVDLNRDTISSGDPDLIFPGEELQIPPAPADPLAPELAPEPEPDPPRAIPDAEGAADGPAFADLDALAQASEEPAAELAAGGGEPDESGVVDAPESAVVTAPAADQTPLRELAAEPLIAPGDFAHQQPETTTISPAEPAETFEEQSVIRARVYVAGFGVVAAACWLAVRRLRGRRQGARPTGTQVQPLSTDAAAIQADLDAAVADVAQEYASEEWHPQRTVAAASRAVAAALPNDPGESQIPAALASEEAVVYQWSTTAPTPSQWFELDGPDRWKLTPDRFLAVETESAGLPAGLPALVTVGHSRGRQISLNLEATQRVDILGDVDDIDATLLMMVTELAFSEHADLLDLITVGVDTELVSVLDRARAVSIDEAVSIATGAADRFARQYEHTTPLGYRCNDDSSTTVPTVILAVAEAANESELTGLVDAVERSRGGVALVYGGDTGAHWQLDIAGDGTVHVTGDMNADISQAALAPVDAERLTTLLDELDNAAPDTYQPISDEPVLAVVDELDLTDHEPVVDPAERPVAFQTTSVVVADSRHDDGAIANGADAHPADDDPSGILVRILGSPTVITEGVDLTPKETELLTILLCAKHRRASRDLLVAKLWPNDDSDPTSRFNKLLGRLRQHLGNPHAVTFDKRLQQYVVADWIRTDVDLIDQAHRAAVADPTAVTLGALEAALELIDGEPFSGAGIKYGWPTADGSYSHAVTRADEAARTLAAHRIDEGRMTEADHIIRQGLRVCEECVELHKLLLTVAATNSRRHLDTTWREIEAIYQDDIPDDLTRHADSLMSAPAPSVAAGA